MSFDIPDTRLRNDYRRVRELVDRSDFVHILAVEGDPPEKYLVRFTCRGVEKLNAHGQPVVSESHEVTVYLHAEYPLKQPQLKWTTPIFHPNIHITGAVCIGAWWPAKTLDELLLSLGEMIQYKNLDPGDPMNSRAALWANRHKHLFPIDNRALKGESVSEQIRIGAEEDSDDYGIKFL